MDWFSSGKFFKGDRTGDLVLSADPGYDLRARYEYPEHHATHGALNAEQMFCAARDQSAHRNRVYPHC